MTLDQLPPQFRDVSYNGERHPQAGAGFAQGANCQHFAYELLRHHGLTVPDLWSSELWAHEGSKRVAAPFEPLDLLLFNRTADPYAAHIAVFLGAGEAVHLSKRVGRPVIWRIEQFFERPEYAVLIGGKRFRP